jgi:hypothetical protein
VNDAERRALRALARNPTAIAVWVIANELELEGSRRIDRIRTAIGCSRATVFRANKALKARGIRLDMGQPGRPRGNGRMGATVSGVSRTGATISRTPPGSLSSYLPPSDQDHKTPSILPARAKRLAPALALELGKDGGSIVRSVRKAWPEILSDAEAARVIRNAVKNGVPVADVPRYFIEARHFEKIERAGAPYAAAASIERVEPWIEAERKKEEIKKRVALTDAENEAREECRRQGVKPSDRARVQAIFRQVLVRRKMPEPAAATVGRKALAR